MSDTYSYLDNHEGQYHYNNNQVNEYLFSAQTNDVFWSPINSIPVDKLYLSQLLEDDQRGIHITADTGRSTIETRISLELENLNHFGLLKLNYKGPEFHVYFPPDSTIKVSELLLKKSNTENNEFCLNDITDSDWNIIHIDTKKERDCDYLFEKAIKDNYTVILAIKLMIIDANNSSEQLALYLDDVNEPLLHRAIKKKDMKIINFLLHLKLDINAKNKASETPLHVAVELDMSDVVDLLIRNGANVHARNGQLQSPLHFAAKNGNSKIINCLLHDKRNIINQDINDQTPLHYAVAAGNENAADILLTYCADFTVEDELSRKPFHFAVQQKKLNMIELFLNDKNVNIVNSRGQTPLFYLSRRSIDPQPSVVNKKTYREIINAMLKKGANINFKDKKDKTPLYYALIKNNSELVQALLECNADITINYNFTENSLHLACQHQANECLRVLLEYNIDINAVHRGNSTALHIATEMNNHEAVKLILEKNPNVDMKDSCNRTALHVAIQKKSLPIVEILLKNGANVNSRCYLEYSALHIAIQSECWPIIELLLKNKVDVNATAYHGKTPLYQAISPNVKYLPCLELIKILVDHKANVNAFDNSLMSPLHLACLLKKAEVVNYLIKNRAHSSMRDKDGRTVFHYTCTYFSDKEYMNDKKEQIKDILNILFEENISVNCVDNTGETPLHYTVENNLLFISELLLNIGADINILDWNNNSALDILMKQKGLSIYKSSLNNPDGVLFSHIVKMKLLGMWIRRRNLDKVYEVDDENHLKQVQDYECACSKEIDSMKNTNIDQTIISYYDFLKNPLGVVNYARNQNIVNAIKSNELIKMFPIYGHFLKCRLRDIQRHYSNSPWCTHFTD